MHPTRRGEGNRHIDRLACFEHVDRWFPLALGAVAGRAEELALSWIGTGRIIFSLNFSDADFEAVATRFVRAAKAMEEDGWWLDAGLTNKGIRRGILKEMIQQRAMS